jgi:hypothetical protein
MCVNFRSQNQTSSSTDRIIQAGVDLSVDSSGQPYSAIARTAISPASTDTFYETEIAFQLRDGVARVQGIVEPSQPSWPHFKTIPAACAQMDNIDEVQSVEQPEETFSRLFERGRWIAHQAGQQSDSE